MSRGFLFIVISFLGALLASCSGALSHVELAETVPLDTAWRTGVLENGLTYFVRANAQPQSRAEFHLVLKAGSLQESDNQRGLAHFLEHMAFHSTRHFPDGGIVRTASRMGLDFGRDLNALTAADNTEFYLRGVPVSPENIDSCLLILHDWASGLELLDGEIEAERAVVREEWRSTQTPSMRIYDQSLEEMYPGSRYGKRLPIGTLEVIDSFRPDDLRKFYTDWYRPDLQTVVAIGDFDPVVMEGMIRERFSDIPMPMGVPAYQDTGVPDNEFPITVVKSDPEQEKPELVAHFKQDILSAGEQGSGYRYYYGFLHRLIINMLNDRLSERMLDADCPFSDAWTGYGMYQVSRTKDAFNVHVDLCQGKESESFEAAMKEVERARRYGFLESEFRRQKKELTSQLDAGHESAGRLTSGDYFQNCRNHILLNHPLVSEPVEYALRKRILSALTLGEVNGCLRRITENVRKNFVVYCRLPDDVQGGEWDFSGVLERLRDCALEPYRDTFRDGPLVRNLPPRGRVIMECDAAFGYREWMLSNGSRVYWKNTGLDEGEILMRAVSYGGESYVSDEDWHTAKVFNEITSHIGLGGFTSLDLRKVLMGHQANISLSLGPTVESISGSAAPGDLKTLMEMAYLCFEEPTDDPEGYALALRELQEEEKEGRGTPYYDFSDTVLVHYYDQDPRGWRIDESDLDRVNFEDYKRMYRKRFSSAGDFDFIFTGDIDEKELRELTEVYLASMPCVSERERLDLSRNPREFTGKSTVSMRHAMETPQSYVQQFWRREVSVTVRDEIMASLLSHIVNERLNGEIRERKGLTYGVEFSCDANWLYNETSMSLYAECTPGKSREVTEAVRRCLDQVVRNGVSFQELGDARLLALKNWRDRLRSGSYWQGAIYNKVLWGMDTHTDYEKHLESITLDEINRFFRECLADSPNALTVIMDPNER